MAVISDFTYEPMVGDPDDHRPDTEWALVADPPREDGRYVRSITCLFERIAAGDRIPLHTHTIDEVVIVDDGAGTYMIDGEAAPVRGGSVIFIPAGAAHGTVNDGGGVMRIHAMYPSTELDITYLERNPAPGTEGDAPQPTLHFGPALDP
jgi:mannose-6-phosphate isomerase-like protein (cupin superfamily)